MDTLYTLFVSLLSAINDYYYYFYYYSRYEKLKLFGFFPTQTTRKSSMFGILRQPSLQQYPLGGAVFREACASAQLIHCIADSGRIPVDRDSVFKHHKALSR